MDPAPELAFISISLAMTVKVEHDSEDFLKKYVFI